MIKSTASSQRSKFCKPLVILAALPRCSLLLFPQNSLRDFCGSPGSLMRFLWEPSSQRSKFCKPLVILAALLRCSLVSRSRACARSGNFPTMGNLQVRRRQRAHRALRKNAPAHPLPTNLLLRKIFAGTLLLPQSRHRSKLRMPRQLPEEEPKIGNLVKFRKHLLAPQTHPKKILRLFLGTPGG